MNSDKYFWYAIYTKSRAEKKTYALLLQRGIDVYLPLQKKLKQWSDRKKWVEEPLFNSYMFVYVSEREYYEVLQTPGVVRYITFSGKAAPIREDQITFLKKILSSESELELSDHQFNVGEKVKVVAGPFHGMSGELVNVKNSKRFLIRFEELNKSIILNIPTVYLEPYF
jgi:transcription antitermination factor NusG